MLYLVQNSLMDNSVINLTQPTELSIDANALSSLEMLSSSCDAMFILGRQAAYRERFATAIAGLEEYKARHPVNASASIADITANSILFQKVLKSDTYLNKIETFK